MALGWTWGTSIVNSIPLLLDLLSQRLPGMDVTIHLVTCVLVLLAGVSVQTWAHVGEKDARRQAKMEQEKKKQEKKKRQDAKKTAGKAADHAAGGAREAARTASAEYQARIRRVEQPSDVPPAAPVAAAAAPVKTAPPPSGVTPVAPAAPATPAAPVNAAPPPRGWSEFGSPPKLPEGLVVHYTGVRHTFPSGNRVEPDLRGKVVGAAAADESRVKVLFDGNKAPVDVRLASLGRGAPAKETELL